MMTDEQRLIGLYAQMARLTNPECGVVCRERRPNRCCDAIYCEWAMEWAADKWGMEIEPLSFVPELPMMGLSGCTLEPHLRPVCTMHTCEINAFGCKRGDPAWTQHYFSLRAQIEALEDKLHGEQP